MKKKVLAIAIATFALGAFSMNAQSTAQTKQECKKECKQECPKDKEGKKGQKGPKDNNAFQGIELTEAQQAAIAQLNEQTQQAREQKKAAMKEARQQARSNRQASDSTARAEAMASRLDYLKSMQNILTPEQYITYLENTAVQNGPGKPRMGKKADKAEFGKNNGRDMKKNGKARMENKKEGKQARKVAKQSEQRQAVQQN